MEQNQPEYEVDEAAPRSEPPEKRKDLGQLVVGLDEFAARVRAGRLVRHALLSNERTQLLDVATQAFLTEYLQCLRSTCERVDVVAALEKRGAFLLYVVAERSPEQDVSFCWSARRKVRVLHHQVNDYESVVAEMAPRVAVELSPLVTHKTVDLCKYLLSVDSRVQSCLKNLLQVLPRLLVGYPIYILFELFQVHECLELPHGLPKFRKALTKVELFHFVLRLIKSLHLLFRALL